MTTLTLRSPTVTWPDLSAVFVTDEAAAATPVHFVKKPLSGALAALDLSPMQLAWIETVKFAGQPGEIVRLPDAQGGLAALVMGLGDGGDTGQPCGPGSYLAGKLATSAPAGAVLRLVGLDDDEAARAALAFGLGAYRFTAYQSAAAVSDDEDDDTPSRARLQLPKSLLARIAPEIEAVWFARDLINTPAGDLGPAELEAAVELLAARHGASVETTVGDRLLTKNFPMIHAVGRASTREPRLIDLRWRPAGETAALPKLTLVGKGICFDTGGLDIKPPAGMNLMKKDMGGAATALALAHMVMARGLAVNLRVLIPAAENSIAGNAFRPGDVLKSRSGQTVEIGNTDAEGRLVLADAMSLADEEKPDRMITLATLTGAARVALGPDLPAFFSNDEAFAAAVLARGLENADPLWRMPLWKNYDKRLKSSIADLNNISDGPFAGAITAALFLNRFVANAKSYAHVDLYGWRPSGMPLGPKGGEPGGARALFAALEDEFGTV